MSHSKLEIKGLEVHKKLKHMIKSYGTMITGIRAETLGQNEAEMQLGTVSKKGTIKKDIEQIVQSSELTQPTNSCGQASNEVCLLLLGIEGANQFEKSAYQCLTDDGSNLKTALAHKNVLVRVEIDRFNAPINKIVQEKSKNLDCWVSTHSFTLFAPQTESDSPPTLFPYQAYWTKHTLQNWFEGNKDETLSQLGMDAYIEKLALLGTTTKTQERSDVYAELFSPPGKEKVFCAGINQKSSTLRIKFKVTEVDPECAFENLESVQAFINTNYPGETVHSQCALYETIARSAMTKQLESRLIPSPAKQDSIVAARTIITPTNIGKNRHAFFDPASNIDRAASSLMARENLKIIAKAADSCTKKEREIVKDFFKTLPQEALAEIKNESKTAQEAWDEQYGLVICKP